MCYIEDGAQAHIQRMDSIESESKIVNCAVCECRVEDSETINIGFDEKYCRKCVEDGSAVQFITDNEREEDLEQALQKFKEAVIN